MIHHQRPPDTRLPALRLTGATVLRDGMMQNRTVAMAGGRIGGGPYSVVDLTGYYVLPGIIDLHGTMPETLHDKTSDSHEIEDSIDVSDRAAAVGGVSTGWLAQGWSWQGGSESPEAAEAVLAAHAACRRRRTRTDLRMQIAYETHTVESADRLLAAVRRFGTDYVVFQNELDTLINLWSKDPVAAAHCASRSGHTAASLIDTAQSARARSRDVPRSLCKLAEAFDANGVTYGSYHEPDGETRELFSALGARICVCPTAFPAASVARALGEPVLMPAAQVVSGASAQGTISTMALIRAGKCAALVSEGNYAAMAQAAFALVDQGVMDLPRAWAMISSAPAHIMRLTDRGEIAAGKRADLVIVDKNSRTVQGTIVGGRVAYLSGDVADRFPPDDGPMNMAAE